VNEHIVGTVRKSGNGTCTFLGFRPRDDQAASLGYEQRTWFEILDALGAYPSTGTFGDVNDNTEHLSRTTDYLCTRFPNQTTAIVRHYTDHAESWHGGFGRIRENDIRYLEENPLPPSGIELNQFRVNGHEVSYTGDLLMAFRLDEQGDLLAFDGRDCRQVVIDGQTFAFADQPLQHVAWTPVVQQRQVPNGAFFQIYLEGEGKVSIPLKTARKGLEMVTEGRVQGSIGENIPFKYRKSRLELELDGKNTGRWLYLTGKD
jgi:hypothetical protein